MYIYEGAVVNMWQEVNTGEHVKTSCLKE